MKPILNYFLLIILEFYLPFFVFSASSKQWCWTKPTTQIEKKAMSTSSGGQNWGYCKTSGLGSNEKVPYRIFIETSNINAAGSSGSFYLTLFGEESQTEEIILTQTGFEPGSTTILRVLGKNVGDVIKIRLRNGGNDAYKCETIRVELGAKLWNFDCDEYIVCPKKCYDTMHLAGNQKYEVTVKTSNQLWAETKAPLYIQFIGIQGKTPIKLLTETGYERGGLQTIQIQTRDVGLIYGIIISMTKSEMWIPEQITVQRTDKETSLFNPKGQYIKCPLRCSLTLTNPKPGDLYASLKSPGDNMLSDSNSEEDNDNNFFNDYLGGALTNTEKQSMIQLTCDTFVKNNDNFGPRYANRRGNFEAILALCPPGCHKIGDTMVYGLGLHPEESSICKSAIVDGAMPLIGGVIGVGVTNGLDFYERSNPKQGIEIKSFQRSSKSFFTYKVDNLDLAEKDLRIITNIGSPSYVGRLEFRLNGVWGTVCSKGMTSMAARVICQNLKYKDGVLKSYPEGEENSDGYCRNFNGEDYCGPEPLPIHYLGLKCEGSESDIFKCYREIPENNACSHQDDAIIECTNSNLDFSESFEMGAVRLVDHDGIPPNKPAGRLEIYKGGKWGSICNEKFNDKAAHVACRQMGYLTGNMIGNVDKYGICSNFNGRNYCGTSSIPIHLNQVDCHGSESALSDCHGYSNPEDCNHEQDVIIQCSGNEGDPTAKSQKKGYNTIGPPYLGKLPMIPIISAKCDTKGSESILRGDPGSIFLINCPENCKNTDGSIWGNGIYTSDSSICKSAIHAGVLQDYGGLIEFIKAPGLSHYESATNRYITSTNYGGWKSSFVISKPNSLAIKMSQSFGSKTKQITSFIELENKEEYIEPQRKLLLMRNPTKRNYLLSKKSNHHSFIQTETSTSLKNNLVKPIFQWLPPTPNFLFNGESTMINTNSLPGVEKTSVLQSLSISVKLIMNRSPLKQQTIVSHSGCGGYALISNEDDEIIFKARCTQTEFRTGFILPLNHPIALVLVYDTNYVLFYVDGFLFNKQAKKFSFKCDKSLDIGAYSELNDEVWNGEIFFVQIYDQALTYESIVFITKNGAFLPNEEKIGRKYTIDGRLCISTCSTNPIPGKSLMRTNNVPLYDNSEGISENEDVKASSNLEESDLVTRITSVEAKCDILGSDQRFTGPSGKKIRVHCPKGCLKSPLGNVFGTNFYTDDSSVCKAALHAGVIRDETGGDVILIIANGEENYQSSYQNGVQAAAHGPNARSITFKDAPQITRIDCYEIGGSTRFSGPLGTRFTVYCEKDCSKKENNVFGNAIYTDDSSVCQAAIHAGLLSDKGGEIQFILEAGKQLYEGSVKNGIKSQRRGTYLRSFRILGDQANTCNYFQENYNPSNIFHNWKVIDGRGAILGPSDWTFNTNPSKYGLAIRQSSFIQGDDYNYGTSLLNRKFDCNDGEYSVNVYLSTTNMVLIFFRYYDANNFYALELNSPGGPNKIKLIKKVEGVGEFISGSTEAVLPRVWYRFKIRYLDTNFQVFRQTGNLRNIQILMNVTDGDLQRGTIGVGTQGNAGAFFDGIEVKSVDSRSKLSEQRIWDQCLAANEGHRKKFCKSIFGSFSDETEKCERLHEFCEMCCDSIIPRLEKILNYGCWKQCVNEAKAYEKRKEEERLAEMELASQMRNVWMPSMDESVDYKPKLLGEKGYFVPAKIYDIDKVYKNEKSPKEMKLIIKFYLDSKPRSEEIIYPNPNLSKCGVMLSGRADC